MSAEPSSSGGVPTAMNWTRPCATPSPASVVKRSRPAAWFFFTISSSPGSKIGIRPAFSASTLAASTSTQSTSWPDLGEHRSLDEADVAGTEYCDAHVKILVRPGRPRGPPLPAYMRMGHPQAGGASFPPAVCRSRAHLPMVAAARDAGVGRREPDTSVGGLLPGRREPPMNSITDRSGGELQRIAEGEAADRTEGRQEKAAHRAAVGRCQSTDHGRWANLPGWRKSMLTRSRSACR